jgi:hypothetical protein
MKIVCAFGGQITCLFAASTAVSASFLRLILFLLRLLLLLLCCVQSALVGAMDIAFAFGGQINWMRYITTMKQRSKFAAAASLTTGMRTACCDAVAVLLLQLFCQQLCPQVASIRITQFVGRHSLLYRRCSCIYCSTRLGYFGNRCGLTHSNTPYCAGAAHFHLA